jgi:hypothetical protein
VYVFGAAQSLHSGADDHRAATAYSAVVSVPRTTTGSFCLRVKRGQHYGSYDCSILSSGCVSGCNAGRPRPDVQMISCAAGVCMMPLVGLQTWSLAALTRAASNRVARCDTQLLAGRSFRLRCSAAAPAAAATAATPIMASVGGEVLAAGVPPVLRRQMGVWLGGTAAWVYTMVVLGGITRLTRSGLSMTDWKFTGRIAWV